MKKKETIPEKDTKEKHDARTNNNDIIATNELVKERINWEIRLKNRRRKN